MDNELFELAVAASLQIPPKNVIGTKTEYRVHGALKYLFQPDDEFHEIRIDGFICDAVKDNEIIEIQTRSFERLKKKLDALTKTHTVTVVYPIITEKRVIVTYSESGECSVRKSPKKGKECDFFTEAYKIREYLKNPRLRFRLVFLVVDESRVYRGTRADRKPFQKPISCERVPTALHSVISLDAPYDYLRMLPDKLPECFNSEIFAKLLGIPRSDAGYALNVLTELGVLSRIGRVGRAYVYEKRLS